MGRKRSFTIGGKTNDIGVIVPPPEPIVPPVWRSEPLSSGSYVVSKIYVSTPKKVVLERCTEEASLYFILVAGEVCAVFNSSRLVVYQLELVYKKSRPDIQVLSESPTVEVVKTTEVDSLTIRVTCFPWVTTPLVRGKKMLFPDRLTIQSRTPFIQSEEFLTSYHLQLQRTESQIAHLRSVAADKDPEAWLDYCLNHPDERFIDASFPGFPKSSEFIWARPSEYLPPRSRTTENSSLLFTSLFSPCVRPEDAVEGDLGDSWLIGAMAALAERESDVVELFAHPKDPLLWSKEHAVGAYRVRLYLKGQWVYVLLDDYLPTIGNVPVYAKNPTTCTQMWVPLVEKAVAKVRGGYRNLKRGDPLHAMEMFTGFPTFRYDYIINDECNNRSSFTTFSNFVKSGHTVLVHTPVPVSDKEKTAIYRKVGLPMGQVFTVLDVATYSMVSTGSIRLVCLRAVCMDAELWKGKWNAASKQWERGIGKHVKSQCWSNKKNPEGPNRAESQLIWLSWLELTRYFAGCGVAFRMERSYHYTIDNHFNTEGIPSFYLLIRCRSATQLAFRLELFAKDEESEPPVEPISLFLYREGLSVLSSPTKVQKIREKAFDFEVSSTDDPWVTSTTFCYAQTDKVSMSHPLELNKSPYLLIPSLYCNPSDHEKQFKLSMWTNASPQDLKVSFVKSQSCRNVTHIDSGGGWKKVSAKYSVKPPGMGPVHELEGSSLNPHGVTTIE